MREKRVVVFKIMLGIAVCAGLGLAAWQFSSELVSVCARVGLSSAKAYLPTFGFLAVETNETNESTAKTEKKSSVKEAKKPPSVKTQQLKPILKSNADDITKTPQDILKFMSEERLKAKNDKRDGGIYKKEYTTSGATDVVGKIRMKNTNKTRVDIEALLSKKADLSVQKGKPSVLITHTHTTETYQPFERDFYKTGFSPRSNNSGQNMVRIGNAICEELEKGGFAYVHDTEIHDAKYNGAYSRSRASIVEYLKKYPSIQVVLDVHRDAIQLSNGTKIKPLATINGKKAAQVMIISGCQEQGNGISDFPDWRENLVFALNLQNRLEELFPGITRPLFFCPRVYNMNLTHCSLLLEVGSDANTLEEAEYSGRCVGRTLCSILEEYTEK